MSKHETLIKDVNESLEEYQTLQLRHEPSTLAQLKYSIARSEIDDYEFDCAQIHEELVTALEDALSRIPSRNEFTYSVEELLERAKAL